MIRLVAFLLAVAAVAAGFGWLADNPGTITIDWLDRTTDVSVFTATVILAVAAATLIVLWSAMRTIWHSPAALGQRIVRRRQKRGLEALSSGMIAVGAGDKALATRYALQARKSLPHEPLTQLLRAQAAQLSGDRATARRIFESMLSAPDTEQLGLRGLFLEAEREGEREAALQFAERAMKSNPKLGWSTDALFDLQCKQRDWAGALETLNLAKRNGLIEKTGAERKRAVLLAGQAQDLEEHETDRALQLALEAHQLAPDLVPAAAVAARILAGRGQTGKAAKVIHKTWARAPHPDLATAYAYARVGDSPRDRLDRIRQLAALNSHSIESPIAIATTAIEARLFPEARDALAPLLDNRLTQRVATLMARIEAGETDDKGRVREWLARAVNAERDPAWTADGVIADRWDPVSPVTGSLDAFQWRVPVENRDSANANILGERLEELLAISAPAPIVATAVAERDETFKAAPAPAAEAEAAPVAPAAPIRRSDAVDANATTVRTSTDDDTASASATPPAATKAHATQVSAKPILPIQRASEVTIVKPSPNTATTASHREVTVPAEVGEPQAAATPKERTVAPGKPPAGKPGDAKIFVAPRAPDDPGPEAAEPEGPEPFPKRFRAVN